MAQAAVARSTLTVLMPLSMRGPAQGICLCGCHGDPSFVAILCHLVPRKEVISVYRLFRRHFLDPCHTIFLPIALPLGGLPLSIPSPISFSLRFQYPSDVDCLLMFPSILSCIPDRFEDNGSETPLPPTNFRGAIY
jgi:hypothetical protein